MAKVTSGDTSQSVSDRLRSAFDMTRALIILSPYVPRVRIRGVWHGHGPSSFTVLMGGLRVIRTQLHTLPDGTYDGIHEARGTVAAIEHSADVTWTVQELPRT